MYSALVAIDNYVNWLAEEHSAKTFFAAGIAFLAIHFLSPIKSGLIPFFILLSSLALLIFGVLTVSPEPISMRRLVSVMFLYSVSIFILISEVLTRGLAKCADS